MSANYYLSIVAYRRGVHWQSNKEKPYHWLLFIRTGDGDDAAEQGIAHQLHGMPGGFHYDGPESILDINKPIAKFLQVDIGCIPREQLDTVTRVCHLVDVIRDESAEWNCQSWTVAVVEDLKKFGYIDSWVDEAYLRGVLKEVDA